MNLGRGLAVYFLMWRKIHGEGAEVPYVGGADQWKIATNLSSMARYVFLIQLCTTPFLIGPA